MVESRHLLGVLSEQGLPQSGVSELPSVVIIQPFDGFDAVRHIQISRYMFYFKL